MFSTQVPFDYHSAVAAEMLANALLCNFFIPEGLRAHQPLLSGRIFDAFNAPRFVTPHDLVYTGVAKKHVLSHEHRSLIRIGRRNGYHVLFASVSYRFLDLFDIGRAQLIADR
ncbi:MAG: hypothetical protein O3C40_36485, partial [Planctomycetota bacterium]|nr:hypothetical protein [Planctomycetota bacterium]